MDSFKYEMSSIHLKVCTKKDFIVWKIEYILASVTEPCKINIMKVIGKHNATATVMKGGLLNKLTGGSML